MADPPLRAGESGASTEHPRLLSLPLWPRSLAMRTLLTLLIGLVFVQGAGLTIHAFDRVGLEHLAAVRDLGVRAATVYRSLVIVPPEDRADLLRQLELPPDIKARLQDSPPVTPEDLTPEPIARAIRITMLLIPVGPRHRPSDVIMRGTPWQHTLVIGMGFPDRGWLVMHFRTPPPRIWGTPTFILAFLSMTVAAALLSIWAVRQLTAPVTTLAAAAERLGRDVNAPPLPEDGPTEVATAAIAFNTMAARIRRFVQDRTFLLTAIGHDLRTPITRLKLRAEFIEDDEQRRKFMADLDELETMVSATLAFGRDAADSEPVASLDLGALLRTVLDEAGDARPDAVEALTYTGPDHLTVRARPVALKRALANLIGNAVKFADSAHVTLRRTEATLVTILIEDDGPGVPVDELERIFDPFHRVESSRNRETGGTGLGLPIARNILRAHGGDVTLVNRPQGGIRVVVTLPV